MDRCHVEQNDHPVINRILGLIALELGLVAMGLVVIASQPITMWGSSPLLFVGYALAMVGFGFLPRVYVEHRRHGSWISPSDGAILIGLFFLGPLGFIAAAMAELVVTLRSRQSGLKTLFNLVSGLGGFTAAATVFAVLGRTDPLDPVAWLCGLAAMAAVSLWDLLSNSLVVSIAEDEPLGRLLRDNGPPIVVSLVLSAMFGLAALILFSHSPLLVLLLAPVLGILLLSSRGVSHQRAERVRFQRLYEASSRLARLVGLRDTVGKIAAEARILATGSAGICIVVHDDGSHEGVVVTDDGDEDVSVLAASQLVGLTAGAMQGAVGTGSLDAASTRECLPASASMVWARKQVEPETEVMLAVFRDLPPDEQDDYRADVLAAFASQAATVIANVELHEDVQRALGRQVELNRQKGEFVASVSHELRTPLASMLSSVQTVQRLGERMSPEERERILELGRSQGSRLHALIEDLLLVAAADHKRVSCVQEALEVPNVFTALVEELASTVDGRLTTDIGTGAERLVSDEDKLRRILINLIGNASKYAPDGPIELEARRDGSKVVFSVTDHGPGIPEADRERIFDRFVQLDQSISRREGGTGLGLHLSRQLAELLGGSLSVTAAPGGGARFELRLAAMTDAEATDTDADGRRDERRVNGHARSPLVRPVDLEPVNRREPQDAATSHRLTTVGLEG